MPHVNPGYPFIVHSEPFPGIKIPAQNCAITYQSPVGDTVANGICFPDSVDGKYGVLNILLELALEGCTDIRMTDREGRELTIL